MVQGRWFGIQLSRHARGTFVEMINVSLLLPGLKSPAHWPISIRCEHHMRRTVGEASLLLCLSVIVQLPQFDFFLWMVVLHPTNHHFVPCLRPPSDLACRVRIVGVVPGIVEV